MVTVTGTGFVAGDTVAFGGVAATLVTVISPTQLTAAAPAGSAGSVADVTVTNAAGTSTKRTADRYLYT